MKPDEIIQGDIYLFRNELAEVFSKYFGSIPFEPGVHDWVILRICKHGINKYVMIKLSKFRREAKEYEG